MLNIRSILILAMIYKVFGTAYAGDDLVGIDTARVFPVQRNTTVIHDSQKQADVNGVDESKVANSSDAPKDGKKDTSLIINGNGGSNNRAPGGNANLRKRFTFD